MECTEYNKTLADIHTQKLVSTLTTHSIGDCLVRGNNILSQWFLKGTL